MGKFFHLRPTDQVFFSHIGQRADDGVFAIVAHQLGWHALELAAEEHVEHQRGQDVVAVVAQRNFGCTQLARDPVQNAPAQAAAQAAHGFAFGNLVSDDGVGVLVLDVKRHAQLGQVCRQDVLGESRVASDRG
jgi:hypothetical protein